MSGLAAAQYLIAKFGNLSRSFLNYFGLIRSGPPAADKWNVIFVILIIQGLGGFAAFNMLIMAKSYFVDYKLKDTTYAGNFLAKLGIAMEFPNLVFTWINVFVKLSGVPKNRILWTLSIQGLLFALTIVLAIVDSSQWPGAFFWLTMVSAFVINAASAIFLNSVFGISTNLPAKYSGAVVLGCNICGAVVALLSWVADAAGGSPRTSAICFFSNGFLVVLVCLGTILALPFNKFYRYHTRPPPRFPRPAPKPSVRPPYGTIFKQSWVQQYNLWLIFFVSFAVYPAVHSDIQSMTGLFGGDFVRITCFLTYNVTTLMGSITATLLNFPSRRWLWVFATARVAFIPFFLLCNYRPRLMGAMIPRTVPVLVRNDLVYWAAAVLLGWSAGHGCVLGMMYVSGGDMEPQHASVAGMIGGAMVVTGVFCGICFSILAPTIICIPCTIWSIHLTFYYVPQVP